MIKIAVLVSGSGSNLQALIDANLSGQIVGVISNKPDAYALERAKKVGIQTAVIEHKQYSTREDFDAVIEWLADGRFDTSELVTDLFAIEDAAAAFERAQQNDSIKVMLQFAPE